MVHSAPVLILAAEKEIVVSACNITTVWANFPAVIFLPKQNRPATAVSNALLKYSSKEVIYKNEIKGQRYSGIDCQTLGTS